ncbi:MAG TPA: ammonium transporter [Pirellulaceae bacterium]|jgi:Amt family ammonium transporter|nr:ammonium transporter [Pirellulaceae bacterium]
MKWKQTFWALALFVAATGAMTAAASIAHAQEADAAIAAPVLPDADAAPVEVVVVEEAAEEEAPVTAESVLGDADTLWTCIAAFLVFFMQAGFALVECGFTRAKNACNIIMKNLMDFSMGTILYWVVGFSLMFGATSAGGWFAWGGDGYFPLLGTMADGTEATPFNWAFLIFQTMFCATAATIVSGAMAERTKFVGYLAYTILITAIVYPVFGSWAWNSLQGSTLGADKGGWLEGMGFYDFAGSTVVHSIGGWCALAGAIVVGARLGKYGKDGRINPIPGHNIPMGALGVFILWMGWFGFNAGSTTAVGGAPFAFICVTTNIAAACGAIGAMITSWILFRKPDPSFSLNGALAGLVSITAGCDAMAPHFAALAGLIGGILVVFSVVAFDKIRIDDPVGAISVHGICGVWGTLAVGLFMTEKGLLVGGGASQLVSQLIGIAAAFLWAFPTSLIVFLAIKYTIGLRVTQQEEIEGLDIGEHGMYAYPPHLVADGMTSGVTHGHGSVYNAPVGAPAGAHS